MKILFISVICSIVAFFLILNKHEKKAILIAIFFIPFFQYPLENSKIHTGLNIGIVGLIIFSIWLGMTIRGMKNNLHFTPQFTHFFFV